MLQLLISGEPVDLSPNASISIDEESPVFTSDSIPGGYSFPFEVPATPKNNRILGHPSRIQSAVQGGRDLPFQLFNDGKYMGTGTATVQKANPLSYSVFLSVGTGDFAGKILGKKLSDFEFGGERTWAFKPEYVYPADDFALFPIYNPKFFDSTQYSLRWASNFFRLNSHEGGAWYNEPDTVMAISPFPYLAYVVSEIFSQLGFAITENVLASDPDFKSLVIYSNHDAAKITTTVTTITKLYYDSRYGEWRLGPVKVSSMDREFTTWDLKHCLPDMLVSDFILAIRTLFNLAITIDRQGFVAIVKRGDLIASRKAVKINAYTAGLSVITIPNEVTGIRLHWVHDNADTLFSDGFKDIYEYPDQVKDPVATITLLNAIAAPEVNEIRLVLESGSYYQYAGTTDNYGVVTYSWLLFSNDFQDYLEGTNPDEFSANASTLPMINYKRLEEGPYIRCPQAAQLSNSSLRITPLPGSLRFMFYRGMLDDSLGTPYPYGSTDCFDMDGVQLPGASLSLKWQGVTGLYAQLWQKYLTWYASRKTVTWLISDPSVLDFVTIYEINDCQYILKKRVLSLDANGSQPAECEFYLV